jgi:hypothetical protein
MVFGWGKKKEETIPATQTMTISEIGSILSQQRHEKQKLAIQKTKPLFEQIQKELSSISTIISQLKSDDLKIDDIDARIRMHVVRSKAEVIETISREVQKHTPQISTYDDLLNASEVLSHTIKKIGDVLGKNSRVIHVFAKKYALQLKTHLEQITKNNLVITKLIGDVTGFESTASEIRNKVEKITQIDSEINQKTGHLGKLAELHEKYVSEIESTEKKISDIKSSPQFAEFLKDKQQMSLLVSQQEKLNKEIDDEFSKISRPLGKYVYVTSLEKPLKAILERLVENHSDAVSVQNKGAIVVVLESCMKAILSGTVSVKESDKSVSQITYLISHLDEFVAKKTGLESQISLLEQKLDAFGEKSLGELERVLGRTRSDKIDSESKMASLRTDLDSVSTQRQKLVEDVAHSLGALGGTKYEIRSA